jgi:NTP pyrophosphatase (non-canonical NTP hydrolase)
MISDDTKRRMLAFRSERDWQQFHTPKNLAASITIEAAELLEIFQWTAESELAATVEKKRTHIEHEIADIAMYLQFLAHDLGVDLDACIGAKLAINEQRYPVAESRGSAAKYDELRAARKREETDP